MLNRQDTQRPHENRRGGYAARGSHGSPLLWKGQDRRIPWRHLLLKADCVHTGLYLNHWLHCRQFFPLLRQNFHKCQRHFWLAQLMGMYFGGWGFYWHQVHGAQGCYWTSYHSQDSPTTKNILGHSPSLLWQMLSYWKLLLVGIKSIVRLFPSQSWEQINSLCIIPGKCKIELGGRWSELWGIRKNTVTT